MTRYVPSRHFLHAALAALAGAALSAAVGVIWPLAWVPAVLFVGSAGVLGWLAFRPPIEIHETHLSVGGRLIPWSDIRRLDTTGWLSPLVLRLALFDDRIVRVIYPGDPDSAGRLLREMRRLARHALIDGVPYHRFWGEAAVGPPRKPPASLRQPVLRPEDEAEVERLYQRLKAVGHLDSKSSPDDE
jgi:hypothetical protein